MKQQINISEPSPRSEALAAIAPRGSIAVGINLSNSLLVTGEGTSSEPTGISPSLAAELAKSMRVPIDLVSFEGPGELVDALAADRIDVGNIGADPAREDDIVFSHPYCQIDATFLVRDSSAITSVADIDRPGVRLASKSRAAYTLWLDRHIEKAEVIHTETLDEATELFADGQVEVLAGLRPRLLEDAERVEDARLLDNRFTSIEQAVGINRRRDPEGLEYLNDFVTWAISSGLIARLIGEFEVSGLTVAPSPR